MRNFLIILITLFISCDTAGDKKSFTKTTARLVNTVELTDKISPLIYEPKHFIINNDTAIAHNSNSVIHFFSLETGEQIKVIDISNFFDYESLLKEIGKNTGEDYYPEYSEGYNDRIKILNLSKYNEQLLCFISISTPRLTKYQGMEAIRMSTAKAALLIDNNKEHDNFIYKILNSDNFNNTLFELGNTFINDTTIAFKKMLVSAKDTLGKMPLTANYSINEKLILNKIHDGKLRVKPDKFKLAEQPFRFIESSFNKYEGGISFSDTKSVYNYETEKIIADVFSEQTKRIVNHQIYNNQLLMYCTEFIDTRKSFFSYIDLNKENKELEHLINIPENEGAQSVHFEDNIAYLLQKQDTIFTLYTYQFSEQ